MRGKARKNEIIEIGARITPACAGKSRVSACKYTVHEDHPRVCGEKSENAMEEVSI